MKKIWIVLPLAALCACVTINIYFPAAAAEKAADMIIDEVWQAAPKANAPKVNKSLAPGVKKEEAK